MMRFLVLFLALNLATFIAQGQTRQVTGSVVDVVSGEALISVSVTVKGTKQGTITNNEGKFTIDVAGPAVLEFEYLGYEQQSVNVSGKSQITVRLVKSASKNMDEVVVIGYGTSRKRDVTGSVAKVSMTDLLKAPVKSFDEALAGRIAGVQVAANDGQPGSPINIVIRGQNSVTQDNSPLYVVDGFPIENPDNNAINPEDIASIEVLKDASATAIYGARGANGVIMITTKRGKVGSPVITYNGTYGIQGGNKKLPVLSPYEFVRMQIEFDPLNAKMLYTPGDPTNASPVVGGKTLDSYKNIEGYDWQDRVFRTAPMQNHNLSLSGGNDKTRYSISGSFFDQQGVIIYSGFKRYQGRVTLDQVVNTKLKVGVNVNYSDTKTYGSPPSQTNSSATSNLLYSAWGYRPVTGSEIDISEDLVDPAIDVNNDYRVNPFQSAQNELRDRLNTNMFANGYAEYKFLPELTLRVTGGVTHNVLEARTFNNSKTALGNSKGFLGVNGVNGSLIFNRTTNWLNENTLTYNKRINKVHNINLLGGIVFQSSKFSRNGSAAIQLPNESLGLSGLDEGTPLSVIASYSSSALTSYLGRINYDYKNRYLLTASIRADGSSKFIQRWGYFPSASFGWRMSEERFMKNISFISDAKLRIGYGLTGNNRVGDFSYLSSMNLPLSSSYAFNNQPTQGIIPSAFGNSDIKWESTSQANIGYDLEFLNGRIALTADVYRKRTYDLILNKPLPSTTGYDDAFVNIGKIQNEGLELSLNTINVKSKDFTWSSGFNISFNRSKVLALSEGLEAMQRGVSWETTYNPSPLYIAKLNQPVSQFYGYVFDGVYQYSDFDNPTPGVYTLKSSVPNNGNGRTTIRPGDIKYRDLNQDNVVDAKDQTVIGRTMPLHIGGFTNNFQYKGFDLNVFFQWSYGNDVFNANRLMFEGNGTNRANLNQYASYADRWTPQNPSNTLFRVKGEGPRVYSSRVIEDASFLRLKTVSIGYNFPASMLQKVKMKSLRVFASAQNLYTWTRYSGLDPEVSVRHTTLTPGFDYSPYPRARTVTFGINTSL
jgi:TonB-linked SusC/RagA family outer membrane protein